jgi:hypothetical protein
LSEILEMDLQQWDSYQFQEIVKLYRHYDTQFWQVPTAVIVVDSFLLGITNSSILIGIDSAVVILLAIVFNIVFTLRQFRITQRLRTLARLLLNLEKITRIDQTRSTTFDEFAQLLQVRVGYGVTVLLIGFTVYLMFLFIQLLLTSI